jgi:hypothetical protein
MTGLRDGQPGFDLWQGEGFFLHTTASRPALGPTQPRIQLVPWAFSLEVNWPGGRGRSEVDDSPPSGTGVKMRGGIPLLAHTPSWRGALLNAGTALPF